MAQIDIENIERIEKERNSIHEKVYTTYSVFEKDNKRFLQIDTYGRNDRENPGKISQSIQVDKMAAKSIVRLLIREFDLL